MRLAVAASPRVAIPTLERLLTSSHEVVAIISQPDAPAGRGRTLTPTPVSQWAIEKSLPLHRTDIAKDIAEICGSVDLLITIGFGVLLPESVLHAPRKGCINLHFSLLPAWRGAAPVQRSIEAGDSVTGVTVFQLDSGMDTGPIYLQKRFALDSDITSDELFIELGELGVEAVLETLSLIEEGVKPKAQSSVGATRALKLSKGEGEISWNSSSQSISSKIRAFTSSPGAWTRFRGETIKVEGPVPTDQRLKAGELAQSPEGLLVGTGDNALLISHVIPAGKSRMESSAWLRGARISEGEYFG